jgi:heat-inducible transcriptional repressor
MVAQNPVELGPRKVEVLRAIVEEYVRTGEPVGSETLADRHRLGVSPATIRNEMSSLEELGLLTHPHTSAGRVPTDLGYRRYVDSLPPRGRLREAQRRAIAQFFEKTVLDVEEVLRGAAQLLSRLTQYAGVAVAPSAPEERIHHAELVEMGSKVLVLVIGQHGQVLSRMIERPVQLQSERIQDLGRRISEEVADLTLAETDPVIARLAREESPDVAPLLSQVQVAFGDMQEGESDHVVVGGVANLAGELALWRAETMRRLFDALEQEAEVLRLLRDTSLQEELSVTIGDEHPATGSWEAALVAAPYRAGDVALGTIGVVGPTRMDYLTTISAVRAVAGRLSELVEQLGI